MSPAPRVRTLERPADPLIDGETGIPALVNKLLAHFGKPAIPRTADLTEFRDALQSMAEYVIPSMPRPSQKELADRARRRRAGLPSIVAMASKAAPSPDAHRLEIAQRVAKARGISVETALSFVPE